MKKLLKNYMLTAMCLMLVFYFSFIFGGYETPLDDVPLIDKWVHVVMYLGTAGVFWLEYERQAIKGNGMKKSKQFLIGVLAFILLGGIIEILQANCTGGRRSGEWLDFLADTIGVLFAWLVLRPIICKLLKLISHENIS